MAGDLKDLDHLLPPTPAEGGMAAQEVRVPSPAAAIRISMSHSHASAVRLLTTPHRLCALQGETQVEEADEVVTMAPTLADREQLEAKVRSWGPNWRTSSQLNGQSLIQRGLGGEKEGKKGRREEPRLCDLRFVCPYPSRLVRGHDRLHMVCLVVMQTSRPSW